MATSTPQPQNIPIQSVLIVGNYCHDVLLQGGEVVAETLGGAASFISNVLSGLSVSFHLISKVGPDFKYAMYYYPIVVPTSKTTVFQAYFNHEDRVLKRVEACDPIYSSDLPDTRFEFGMAVGVGGEILPETLEKMIDNCGAVFVDIQALIRAFDKNGMVKFVELKESGFYHLLPRVKFLKASSEEAPFMDIEEVRQWCYVVITHGKDGCEIYSKDGEMKIETFDAKQVDPTGCGDSFLGGFVGGFVLGLGVHDAALMGNFFGSLTVAQISLPWFDSILLQRVKDEIQKRKVNCREDDHLSLSKLPGHQEFQTSLASTMLAFIEDQEYGRDPSSRSSRTIEQVVLLVASVFEKFANFF